MLRLIGDFLWGYVIIFGLVGVGLALTMASRFVQIRYFLKMFGVLKQSFHHQPGHLSSFQALAMTVGGRVGAGNIAGVAVAITAGGPGAIFWMWLVGMVGMATSFFECSLAQLFKTSKKDGTFRGGPAHYISRGLGMKRMAGLFSILLLINSGFFMAAFQSFTVASSVEQAFGLPTIVTGLVLVFLLFIIIFGGVKRIASVAEMLVPFMALSYILVALIVIVMNFTELPAVISLIFRSAFGLEQVFGGGIGAAIVFGAKRGLFSNEAGLGTAPNVAAVAYVNHPASQGIVQAFSVFIDTAVICTCTATIILLSDLYTPGSGMEGVVLTQAALAQHVGNWGQAFISIALALFAFTSIMYSYYLGENCLEYFIQDNKSLINSFRLVVLCMVMWGTMQDLSTIFAITDLMMGLVVTVNLIALVLLFKVGLKLLADYDSQIRAGQKNPVFDPSKFPDLNLDITAWNNLPSNRNG
jgi:AGCS family alanine or glycine:cation symporter